MSREGLPLLCLGWRSEADLWWVEYKSSGMENTFWTGGAEMGGVDASGMSKLECLAVLPAVLDRSFSLTGVPRRARREGVVLTLVLMLVLMSGAVVALVVAER